MAHSDRLFPSIETERLLLRRRTPDDANSLFVALSDADLMKWWSRAPFDSVDEVIEDFIRKDNDSDWRAWAVTVKGNDRAIGFVATGEKRVGVYEIGYLLIPEAAGRGIAHEAMIGLINLIFEEGNRRVFADTDPDNKESIALLNRLGFILEGRLRNEWHTHIGVRDSLIFGMIADDWKT